MSKLEFKIVNAQGTVLLAAHKIHSRDKKIVLDGNMMGTMPGQFYLTPLDVYKATKMLTLDTVKAAAGIWLEGRREFKAAEKAEKAQAGEASTVQA